MVDYGDTSKEKKGTFTVLDTLPCAIHGYIMVQIIE